MTFDELETADRDALCAEVRRCWDALAAKTSVSTYGVGEHESLTEAATRVVRERDKARAEVARLRATAAEAVTAEIATRMQVERALRGESVEEPRCDAVILAARAADELRDVRVERDHLRADLTAITADAAAVVQAWERASEEERDLADLHVPGLRQAMETLRKGGREGWWK